MRSLAHISDLHFGRIDSRIAEALGADLSERKPNLVVVSGDLTQRARAGQYRAAAELLARLPKPQIVVPGNHDVPLYDIFHRAFGPLTNFRRYIAADLQPVFRDEEIFVVGLNTARAFSWRLKGFWKDGQISAEQLADLRREMETVPGTVFRVVVTHHPFIPPPNHDPRDVVHGGAAALETMEQCGVDLLLAGHLHMGYHDDVRTHYESAQRSILSVQAGTATSTRRRGQANSYNWITIDKDAVTIEARAWNGEAFATHSVSRFVRRDGVWKADSVE
jgi:3',5'-cyclic AMP phosphodiesterase CpdA